MDRSFPKVKAEEKYLPKAQSQTTSLSKPESRFLALLPPIRGRCIATGETDGVIVSNKAKFQE